MIKPQEMRVKTELFLLPVTWAGSSCRWKDETASLVLVDEVQYGLQGNPSPSQKQQTRCLVWKFKRNRDMFDWELPAAGSPGGADGVAGPSQTLLIRTPGGWRALPAFRTSPIPSRAESSPLCSVRVPDLLPSLFSFGKNSSGVPLSVPCMGSTA